MNEHTIPVDPPTIVTPYVDPPTVEQPVPDATTITDASDRLRAAGYTVTSFRSGLPTLYADLTVGKRRAEVVIVRGAYQLVTETRPKGKSHVAEDHWPAIPSDAVHLAVKLSGDMGWIAPSIEADEQPPVIGDALVAGAEHAEDDHAGEVEEDTSTAEAGAA